MRGPGKQNERAYERCHTVTLAVRTLYATHLMLREELVVGVQVGRSDRRRDDVLLCRRRPCLPVHLRRPRCRQHGGDDVPAQPLGDEVHGRASAVSIEHTVECLQEKSQRLTDQNVIATPYQYVLGAYFLHWVKRVFCYYNTQLNMLLSSSIYKFNLSKIELSSFFTFFLPLNFPAVRQY
jgi:hypothetical protein